MDFLIIWKKVCGNLGAGLEQTPFSEWLRRPGANEKKFDKLFLSFFLWAPHISPTGILATRKHSGYPTTQTPKPKTTILPRHTTPLPFFFFFLVLAAPFNATPFLSFYHTSLHHPLFDKLTLNPRYSPIPYFKRKYRNFALLLTVTAGLCALFNRGRTNPGG